MVTQGMPQKLQNISVAEALIYYSGDSRKIISETIAIRVVKRLCGKPLSLDISSVDKIGRFRDPGANVFEGIGGWNRPDPALTKLT